MSGGLDETIKIWNIISGDVLRELATGSLNEAYCRAIILYEKWVITADFNSTIKFWDFENG